MPGPKTQHETMPHDFLHDLYDSLNDSPFQRKIRALCPLPIGVVWVQGENDGPAELRAALRQIRECGFDNLKQFHFAGRYPFTPGEAELIALEEGVIPWHYGIGGWQEITNALLEKLEVEPGLSNQDIQAHPAMRKFQSALLRARATNLKAKPRPPEVPGGLGEPARFEGRVPPEQHADFLEWLREHYQTPERCRDAYRLFELQNPSWEDLAAPFLAHDKETEKFVLGWTDFRRVRDVMRFQADRHGRGIRAFANWHRDWDAEEPIRTGCHMILDNQAQSGWDFENQAAAVRTAGSFYASFHPAHHLDAVEGELAIGTYLSARYANDFFKGGWSAMWESVGGPSVYSGSRGFACGADELSQCLLSYLAAGLKGVGIWSWNVRDAGWELGEYALCDLQNRPTQRARIAGQIAKAARKWRFELWEARDEPQVGIFYSWENEAAFARLGLGGYPQPRLEEFPHLPGRSRIGVARALLNAQIPFEFVTERDLAVGLAFRYPTIYLPGALCLPRESLRRLREYAENGGRLILEAPAPLLDETGVLFDTRKGSDFEQVFGWEHCAIQGESAALKWNGVAIEGQSFELEPTTASVVRHFDDSSRPALVRNGDVYALSFGAAATCWKPGQAVLEKLVAELCGTSALHISTASGAKVWALRRVAPRADHYFLLNPTPDSQTACLSVADAVHSRVEDAISGEILELSRVEIAPQGARWLRLEKP